MTYEEIMYLAMGLISGFIIGALVVTGIYVFSKKCE